MTIQILKWCGCIITHTLKHTHSLRVQTGIDEWVCVCVFRIFAVITRVTLSAWLTWAPYVLQRGAVPSSRTTAFTQRSPWHMRSVQTRTHTNNPRACTNTSMTSLPVCVRRAPAGSVPRWLEVLRGALRLHWGQATDVVHPDLHRRVQTLEPLHVRHHHGLLRRRQWWETNMTEFNVAFLSL